MAFGRHVLIFAYLLQKTGNFDHSKIVAVMFEVIVNRSSITVMTVIVL